MYDSTHRVALIFQSTLFSAYLRAQRSFKACNGDECKDQLIELTGQVLVVTKHIFKKISPHMAFNTIIKQDSTIFS
ncbi:hypothetical protein H5410_046859 [Solanum commersonii]|uniref:Uncharacterized protein n=1 Tax=Solanum commersonii TaxID=4109 RepID=A0A9J5XDE2_SOLCO|nr:hypothetical protein H5410_046859 [Solanum commersonii]